MSEEQTFLPVPTPGHDPSWWLLDSCTGWRAASLRQVEQTACALSLQQAAGSARSLAEASGSLGGLTPPLNVAVMQDGSIYLLDLEAAQLKRFDPCTCLFTRVPCISGPGVGARQLLDPHGIGIFSGNLYVCDTGNRQLKVFSLYGLALRAILAPPKSSPLNATWQPYDVAFGCRGTVYVSDPANGLVHRFSPSGRWIDPPFGALGNVRALAADRDGRLYVVTTDNAGAPAVVVLNEDGERAPGVVSDRPADLSGSFPPSPFPVDAAGNIYLSELCTVETPTAKARACQSSEQSIASAKARGVFDRRGNPLANIPQQSGPLYEAQGYYYSQPLDSKLYKCQWHRIIMNMLVPEGARVRVWTYTAESELGDDTIASLADSDWDGGQVAMGMDGGWDCLVRSGGGRYLWLKVQLRGNGAVTPQIKSMRVEYPRISLARYLPAVFAADPSATDFTDRFLSLFDVALRSIEAEIDTQARFFDPLSTPAKSATSATPASKGSSDFLSWLGSWIGVSLDRYQPEARRRLLVKRAARLYQIRGTREGLRRQLLFYLGWDAVAESLGGTDDCDLSQEERESGRRARRTSPTCHPKPDNCRPPESPSRWRLPLVILEHYRLRRWLFAGSARVGDQAVLWGRSIVNRSQLDENAQVDRSQLITTQDPQRDPFYVYAHKFTVFVPAWVGREPRYRRGFEKLLQSETPAHALGYVRYVEPRFRIGVQSSIGFDSVVGCYPQGVTLGGTPLGPASVLPESPQARGGPSMSVGRGTRIGASRLT